MYYNPMDDMDRGHCKKEKKCHDNCNMQHENQKHHMEKKDNNKMHKCGMPMQQMPIQQAPINHIPMNQMPVNQMPINQMPANMNMAPMHKVPQKLLDMMVEAMKDERADRAKYKMMMEMTCNDKCKRQINFAYEDEGKHYKMFQYIYRQLTGQDIEIPVPKMHKLGSLKEAIESSIDGELEAVELYRQIQAMLPTRQFRDMLFEIITDEQEHATRFVFLCGCNKC